MQVPGQSASSAAKEFFFAEDRLAELQGFSVSPTDLPSTAIAISSKARDRRDIALVDSEGEQSIRLE